MFIALFIASVTVFSTIAVAQNIRDAKREEFSKAESASADGSIGKAA